MELPQDFGERITRVFPERAPAWFDALPALLAEYEQRWDLKLGPPFELSYSYVAPATRSDGSHAVFKAVVPNKEVLTEIAALRHYDGHGAVALLEADAERGVMLLERAEPGDMLLTVTDDDERTMIAADVMRSMLQPAPDGHAFRTIGYWAQAFERLRAKFDGGTGPLPAALVDWAEAVMAEAYQPSPRDVLLHGDLHHGNILRATRPGREPWLVIDPKGILGPPEYEPSQIFMNPWKKHIELVQLIGLIPRRLDILSEQLGFDRKRLAAWGFHKAMLSATWTVEDGGDDYGWAVAVAEGLVAEL